MAVICTGFVISAQLTAKFEGLQDIRLIEYPPPNITVSSPEEVRERANRLVDEVINKLTKHEGGGGKVPEKSTGSANREIIFSGVLDQVNEFFYQKRWTDGLPIVPPTIEAVEAMLNFTDRSPDEVIGVLRPGSCEATVWGVAVNGVMAGCRPEYMPILIAITEAISDPKFGLQHAGSTVGWTPLIILNGPIIKELDFNYGQGVFRPERRANITVSRFLRLCMVNIAQFRLGETDMATFGRNYLPVLAEAEDESPWPPFSVDRGFEPGTNVVTVQSCADVGHHYISVGSAAEHLDALAQEVTRELGSQIVAVLARFGPEAHPVICLTPAVATIIAEAGYSKSDIRRYLYENARITARQFDHQLRPQESTLTINKAVKLGKLPPDFGATEDPNRMVPVVHNAEEFFIVVSGMSLRNRTCVLSQVSYQGLPVSKGIKLPTNWKLMLNAIEPRARALGEIDSSI